MLQCAVNYAWFGLYQNERYTYQLIKLVSLTGAPYCFLIGDPMNNSPEVKWGNSLRISTNG